MLRRWWDKYPDRYRDELGAFDRVGIALEADPTELARGRLVLRGDASIAAGETTRLIVVYPDTFPSTRFTIYAPDLKLPRHQEPFHGNLCIFPRGSNHWDPAFLAADVIKDRLPELIALVREGGEALRQAEDPQGEPFSTYLTYYPFGGVVVPEAALRLDPAIPRGMFTLRLDGPLSWLDQMLAEPSGIPQIGKGLLTRVAGQNGELLAEADPQLSATFVGPEIDGHWVRLKLPQDALTPKGLLESVLAKLPKFAMNKGRHATKAGRLDVTGAVFTEEIQQGVSGDVWVFPAFARRSQKRPPERPAILRGLRFGPAQLAARIPELGGLRQRTVAIVGLGTLGAAIAHELARAQVKELRLADPDFVDPATGVRWVTQLDGAGALKIHALATTLGRNYPYTTLRGWPLRVGDGPIECDPSQREGAQLEQLLSGVDLLIDATAEDNVSRALSYVADELRLPQLFAYSVDGFGGVVARLVPGKTGCFHCLSLLMSAADIIPPPAAADADRIRVQPIGCADPTFTGAGVDLMPLATQASRLAISTLAAGVPGAYPDSAYDVFVLALRNPDGSQLSPSWTPYKLAPVEKCSNCSPG